MLSVKNERITAVVTLAVQIFLVINSVLVAMGKDPIPLDETQITSAATYVATVFWSVWTWWRNNNVTRAAVMGQEVTNNYKD